MIVCSFAAHFRMLSVETVWLEEEGEESSDGPVWLRMNCEWHFCQDKWTEQCILHHTACKGCQAAFFPPSPSLPSCSKTTFKGMKGAENV